MAADSRRLPAPRRARGRAPHEGCLRAAFAILLAVPGAGAAQTDFYNLDHGRPLRTEDAYTTARWAFEIQASPFTLSQDRSGAIRFAPSVELKHGLLPGFEISAATSVVTIREESETRTRLGEVEVSALLNLWIEGRRLPAAGVRLLGHFPTDSDQTASMEARGILTRGIAGPIRAHLNGGVVLGEDRAEDWWTGLAVDYVLPFHHTLLLAETWVASRDGRDDRVHSGVGVRLQISPTLLADAGLGRDWSGELRRDWVVTVGFTHEFGVRALMPGGDR